MRSVALSNTLLVVTPAPYGDLPDDALIIHDQVNEILELTPVVPKLHKLSALLKGKEYAQDHEDEDMEDDATEVCQLYSSGEPVADSDAGKKTSYTQLRETVQASDAELERGLREKRILDINSA